MIVIGKLGSKTFAWNKKKDISRKKKTAGLVQDYGKFEERNRKKKI